MNDIRIEHLRVNVSDGLDLHGRALIAGPQSGAKSPVVCLPGLTRNAADFEDIAPLLADEGRDVYAFSLRGRGWSDHARDHTSYHPLTYKDDILAALDALSIEKAVFVGTSLGGIVTMLINAAAPRRVAGAALNDIGPDLAPEGLARIAGYVGARADGAARKPPHATLDAAAAEIRSINEAAFPDRDTAFWLRFAARTYRQTRAGWMLDYDPGVAHAFTDAPAPPELWGPFESLKQTPTLVVRGQLSDLLSKDIVSRMRDAHPNFDYCEVAQTGHAPTLTEPEAVNALRTFLSAID